jgi:hypothetical protein
LKEGKAININITAGVIVHISSIRVPCLVYLRDIGEFLLEKLLIKETIIHPTPNNIIVK